MVLIVLGPQGSGKNTQADLLADRLHIARYFNADQLRAEVTAQSEIGKKIEPILKRGDLIPDEIVIAITREKLKDVDMSQGIVFEGIPRTMAQVGPFTSLIKELGAAEPWLIELNISDETALQRLSKRKRSDDTPETIANRLKNYHRETEPVIEHFKALGHHIAINGEEGIEAVYNEIIRELTTRHIIN